MEELRVPTVAVPASVVLADGRALEGEIFAPASAATHGGPMRPHEWLNAPQGFLPLRPRGERPVIVNKAAIAVVSVPSASEAHDPDVESVLHSVRVECGGAEWRGQIAHNLPRLQDFLNLPERFFVLRAGERDHICHKRLVTLVLEEPGA